jgi:PAS domain S-box-containing protein
VQEVLDSNMKTKTGKELYFPFGLSLTAMGIVFLIDTFTPKGYLDWFLYIPVIIYASLALPKKNTIMLTLFSILLTAAGYFSSPAGIAPQLAVTNRIIGILILWMTSALFLHHNKEREYTEEFERQFKAVLDKMDRGITYLHINDIIILTNRKLEKLLGFQGEELVNKNILDLIHPEDKLEFVETKEKIISNLLRSDTLNIRLLNKNGDPVRVNLLLNRLQNDFSDSRYLIAFIQELSDSKKKLARNRIAVMETENMLNNFSNRLKEFSPRETGT